MSIPLSDFIRTFDRSTLAEHITSATAKRAEIVKRFPISAWATLTLEQYALGTPHSKESFCYALEYASDALGSIAGGNADKHLIYWKAETNSWKFDSDTYKDADSAWSAIRAGFVEAIQLGDAGKFGDVDEISALKGARVVRTKFLSLYYPKAILPVLSKAHLVYFLDALGEKVADQDSRKTVTLNLRLTSKLREFPPLRNWSNDELAVFLYKWNPPTAEVKLLKISPGDGARFWESDCLPQGMICVGWDEVGDLRSYADFKTFRAAFEKEFLEGYKGNQSTVTRKARELWLLRDLEEGDLIAANRGTKEILAIGQVISPGYTWDPTRGEYCHTVKVSWDQSRSGEIEPVNMWVNTTVENITGERRKTILGLQRDTASSIRAKIIRQNPPPYTDSMTTTNLILFGPPGTGKTYYLQQLHKKYTETPHAQDREAWLESLVADFGWRSAIAAALDQLGPTKVRTICDHELIKAKVRSNRRERNISNTIWVTLQAHTPESVKTVQKGQRREPFIFTKSEDSIWSLLSDWQSNDEEASNLAKLYRAGPTNSASPIKRFRQVTFHPSFSYEDFIRGIRPVAIGDDDRTEFRMVDGVFKQICDEARANPTKRYALFIDEINRGNIAKIFGELITLIEPDKRIQIGTDGTIQNGMTVQLPGDGGGEVVEPAFGVPANLDIYGTMNTADRSIALLDIALRRRFEFRETPPLYGANIFSTPIAGVDCATLLRRINDRLEYLLDRDHRIGHAYLMKAATMEQLRKAFANQIIPLLQEYFFDDLAKVAQTLAGPDGTSPFVKKEILQHEQLFPGARRQTAGASRERFVVTDPDSWKETDFVAIYTAPTQLAEVEAIEEA